MRRTLLLLALLVAGLGGAVPGDSARSGDVDAFGSSAFQASAGGLLVPGTGLDSAGPGPRPLSRRGDSAVHGSATLLQRRQLDAAWVSRATEHLQFAGRLALARSGSLTSAPSTAPPSFPLI